VGLGTIEVVGSDGFRCMSRNNGKTAKSEQHEGVFYGFYSSATGLMLGNSLRFF
jgi:hypothetical protein